MGGVLVTGRGATPPEHCHGTLEQGTEPPNAHIRPYKEQWRTLHPPICSWDRPLHSPHDPERDIRAKREKISLPNKCQNIFSRCHPSHMTEQRIMCACRMVYTNCNFHGGAQFVKMRRI